MSETLNITLHIRQLCQRPLLTRTKTQLEELKSTQQITLRSSPKLGPMDLTTRLNLI